MDNKQKKYPVWELGGDYLPDGSTTYCIPCEPIPGLERLGGGVRNLLDFIEHIVDDIPGFFDPDGEKIFDLSIEYWTLDRLNDISTLDDE